MISNNFGRRKNDPAKDRKALATYVELKGYKHGRPNKETIMDSFSLEEIAKELGVYDEVKKPGGWSNVSSKTCGKMVQVAIEIANRSVER